jgi:putative oxygen-independent coproporphyrinogen III oxidase
MLRAHAARLAARARPAARAHAASAAAAAAARAPADALAPPPPRLPPRAAYVHLPFCKRKCLYCDFPVIAVGGRAPDGRVAADIAAYVDLVLREISASARLNPPDAPLTSVYFGGGTPSLVPPALLEALVTALDRAFGLAVGAEVSLEADPGTFSAAGLRSYLALGVTRLSVGVQSFDDALLAACGRAHDAADAWRAVEAVHAAAPRSWSLDLMSGLPGLTEPGWAATLAAALDAGAPHLSVYDLQVEPDTPFGRMYRAGEAPLPPDAAAARMFEEASGTLRAAGYGHYEVSSYARPGHRCAHNEAYWAPAPYYAFGMGAASYLEGRRFSRPRRLAGYARWLAEYEAAGAAAGAAAAARGAADEGDAAAAGGAVAGAELPAESTEDRLTDAVMLRLRLSDGLDLDGLRAAFPPGAGFPDGAAAADAIAAALAEREQRGHAVVEWEGEGRARRARLARLVDPAGLLLSNDVISDVFAALERLKEDSR